MITRPSRTRPGAARVPYAPAALAATILATLCLAAPAAAATIPAPPPQGVKMQPPATPVPGQALVVNDVATQPTQQWYAAGPGSSNSTGFTGYVIRTGTGGYRVWLPGLGPHGAAVVTAAAGAAHEAYCVVSDIVGITDRDVPGTDVVVSCLRDLGFAQNAGPAHASAGTTAEDATFTLSYFYLEIDDLAEPSPGTGPSAYLRATRPAERSYVPDLAYQYHVTGEPSVVDRLGTGDYLVQLPGLGRLVGGRADVTGYGPGGHRCEPGRQVAAATTLVVGVRCLAADGAPADAPFGFVFASPGG